MSTADERRSRLVLLTVAATLEQALATTQGTLPEDLVAAAATLASYASAPTAAAHAAAPAVGAVASEVRMIGVDDTAAAMGHPDPTMHVLGSPRLALWFEVGTSALMPEPSGGVSHVGVGILVHHVGRALVGEDVTLTATVASVTGRTIIFTCEARVGERVVAIGVHQRVILDHPPAPPDS